MGLWLIYMESKHLERYQVTHGIEGKYGKLGQENECEPRSQAAENTGEVMLQAIQLEDLTGHTTTHFATTTGASTQTVPGHLSAISLLLPQLKTTC